MNEQNNPTPMRVEMDKIMSAAWNTHRPSQKDDADFRGLCESMAANGLIHRVVIRGASSAARAGDAAMADGAAVYEIVDGHRRFEAAKALGWTEIPCEVWTDMDDDYARTMMLTANVQRLGNDPIMEAELIEKLAGAGKTYEQIAATLGKDARYVARRARLCNLTDKWRTWFGHVDADADIMETVAAHERELQDEVYAALEIDQDGELDADVIEHAFERRLRKLDEDTAFDIEDAGCMTCPNNTANHGMLFPAEQGDCAGRCEKSACFTAHWNAAIDEMIEALRKKKVEVKEVANKWNIPNSWTTTARRTKKNTVPYVWNDGGLKHLAWSEPAVEAENARDAMTEEEKRVKKAQAAWKRNRRAAYDKIRCMTSDFEQSKRIVDDVVSTDCFIKTMADRFRKRVGSWTSDDDCMIIYRSLEADGLMDHGVTLTVDEVKALMSKDPAEAENEEEA